MKIDMLKSMYNIKRKSIKTTFLDNSFPAVVLMMMTVNLFSLWYLDVIYSDDAVGIIYEPINASSFFAFLLVMAYGGYLGIKFFARDIESKRMNTLFLIPDGNGPILFGKITAGILLIGLLSLTYFVHASITLSYWGTVSILTLDRILINSTLIFLGSVFLFSLTVVVSLFSKKVMPTSFFSSAYLISSVFLMQFVESAEKSFEILLQVSVFPILSFFYNIHFTGEYGSLPHIFFLVPLVGISGSLFISYLIFDGVKS